MSVSTPKHLHKIGLLDKVERNYETDINVLMTMALDKLVFLPFAYTLENWRWDVFSGKTSLDDMNCAWWDKRYF